MKSVFSSLLTLVLLTGPLACLGAQCSLIQAAHDFCHRPTGLAACSYDILSAAKMVQPPQKWTPADAVSNLQQVTAGAETSSPHLTVSIVSDGRDLHLQNRVLRI